MVGEKRETALRNMRRKQHVPGGYAGSTKSQPSFVIVSVKVIRADVCVCVWWRSLFEGGLIAEVVIAVSLC